MNAAPAESLIVGGDHDVARLDESFDAGHAVIGPCIAADKKILIERLRRIDHLGRTAVLGRAGRAVRPGDDRPAPFSERRPSAR